MSTENVFRFHPAIRETIVKNLEKYMQSGTGPVQEDVLVQVVEKSIEDALSGAFSQFIEQGVKNLFSGILGKFVKK